MIPIFPAASHHQRTLDCLGNPPRLYPYGEAPQDVKLPYAVWEEAGGSPFNHLSGRPTMDAMDCLLDVYATTPEELELVMSALQHLIETHAHITGYAGGNRDKETRLYHAGLSFDWLAERSTCERA